MKRNIGKNTIGDNDKMSVELKDYGRSTHDLSYAWRSPIGVGTLVPFMKVLATPGDVFDINLEQKVLTHPTVGPLYGNYKIQLDVFTCPIRLYQAQLHNNSLGIGLNMKSVKLPVAEIGTEDTGDKYFPRLNRTSIYNYLGYKDTHQGEYVNIVPILMYLDAFKNYYANKQEEKFYMLGHGTITTQVRAYGKSNTGITLKADGSTGRWLVTGIIGYQSEYDLEGYAGNPQVTISDGKGHTAKITPIPNSPATWQYGKDGVMFTKYIQYTGQPFTISGASDGTWYVVQEQVDEMTVDIGDAPIPYDLKDIDDIRARILALWQTQWRLSKLIKSNIPTLDSILGIRTEDTKKMPSMNSGGLILKTYMSDLFNNWVNSEWVDGDNGITAVTKIDTSGGSFTIDTLNLAQKVYNMLNRIAISGGTYKDWIETVYTTDYYFRAETPVYEGGMSATISFGEVVSQSATDDEPLGTLAGRGYGNDQRGGNLKITVNEPSYLLGLVSITPYLDYSQGNDWDIYLDNMDELHKPQLDGIGYQDLMQSWMDGRADRSAALGKQPAWIQYMTNFNRTHGNFAAGGNESFMCLNRIYEIDEETKTITNATTYVNPRDYTYIFAENSIDNTDFWVQIGVKMIARRVMSAKQIPLM